MRLKLLFFLFSLLSFTLNAQQKYSRVKILFDSAHTLTGLAEMGLDVEHGHYQPGKYFTGEFSEGEITAIKQAGFSTEILVEDLQAHLQKLNSDGFSEERSIPPCNIVAPIQYDMPQHYTDGSMAGYFTYQEMLDILDTMSVLFPNIFKARQPISQTLTTHEGRPIFWVKISDNPNNDEPDEPEVLYTALHHAREPNSLSQMIFYLWYLLEHYETDDEVKYLVDNTELYFIPCVNPDGYIYNETTNPDGGGYWRKNRRDNGGGSFGVDLNRNYGYQWGYDDAGSSPNPDEEVYRGPGPFSEPETQMVRDFCLSRHFQIALNYHTFGNLFIWPWGFADSPSPDHPTFSAFGDWMTRDNDFLAGVGTQTVGYTTNGNSDDWMYGEQVAKAKTFSITPEVGPGSFGFWPPQSAIDGLNKKCMTMNLTAAHLVLNFGLVTASGERFIADHQGDVFFSLKKIGLAPGELTVSLEPVSDNVAVVGPPKNFGLFHLEEVAGSIGFTLKTSIQEGDTVLFDLVLDNGLYQWRQPVIKIFTAHAGLAFYEPGDDASQWSTFGNWASTTEDFVSAPASITDSPGNDYHPNDFSEISLENPLVIKNAASAYLTFWAKWDIEEDEDYAQALISVNGGAYTPLCGKYTEPGTSEQVTDEPVYDGVQQNWVKEEIDLSDYLGQSDSVTFDISFWLRSDEFIEGDGFYFDDLAVTVVSKEDVTSTVSFEDSDFAIKSLPNPAGDFVFIETEGLPFKNVKLLVFNALGQQIATEPLTGRTLLLDTKSWKPGIYFYRLSVEGKMLPGKRLVIAR